MSELEHRGSDPVAIMVAEKHDLLFDGMQPMPGNNPAQYHFTTSDRYLPDGRGISFTVASLDQVEKRLDEKLKEFGL